MSATAQTALLATAFVVLWNSGFIGAEYGLPFTGPLTLLFWRYLALAALLGFYLAALGRLQWPGARRAGHATLVGVLAHGVWLGCVFIALERDVPAALVALVVALQPLATGALSGAVTGERTAWSQWLGLIVGFAGVVIAVGARFELDGDASLVGLLAPFGSVVAITIATLLERRSSLRSPEDHLPVDTALLYQSLGTAIVVAVPAWWLEGFATEWNTTFVVTMAWLIVAVSLGAYGLMWQLLKLTDATRVASLFYLGPPVTAVMAYLAFGDRLALAEWVGMVVVAAGVALVQFGKTDRRPARAVD
ncbi:MAG: DMT family transporter [Halofilum sp. (in: g-proteobacteria)]